MSILTTNMTIYSRRVISSLPVRYGGGADAAAGDDVTQVIVVAMKVSL